MLTTNRKSFASRKPSARILDADSSRDGRRDGMVSSPGDTY